MTMPIENHASAMMPPNGSGAAAVLAAGGGAFAIGLIALAADRMPQLARVLIFYRPTGPLSGVSTVAILLWLATWAVLHFFWKKQTVNLRRIITISLTLLGVGILLTFPPFADML
jgi:hypothetical protein